MFKFLVFCCIVVLLKENAFAHNFEENVPTIMIAVLVRNKAHTLPYFMTCIRDLNYPKERIVLWIYSDHNKDNSDQVLENWLSVHKKAYNNVNVTYLKDTAHLHPDESKPNHWSYQHFKHVIQLREEALQVARKTWADYIFMIDADVFLTNKDSLQLLLDKKKPIVAPMLLSDGLYSNFWCGMTEDYYYLRTDDYSEILNRNKLGCFDVPMIHSAVLINMKIVDSNKYTYVPENVLGYDGPYDDIIAFAINSRNIGVPLEICNDHEYGFVTVPLSEEDVIENDIEQLINAKLNAISRGTPLLVDDELSDLVSYPYEWKFGCDEIYMINLERRHSRRHLMQSSFKELGMKVTLFLAVDGSVLDINDLNEHSIKLMPGYEDPYHKRPMKLGEIGCFLSHYNIWNEIVKNGYQTTLVLEDDIRFVPYFRHKFLHLLKDLRGFDWDLVYIGRKILMDSEEEYVTDNLVKPMYSYWTVGYLISQTGAKKLLNAKPLDKMLPVDEFLPIMFDQHPNDTWKSYFTVRDLKAFSVTPLLIYPTHYTGEVGYISDTEASPIITAQTTLNEAKVEL